MEKHFKNMEMKARETLLYLVLLQKKTENHESDEKRPWTAGIYSSFLVLKLESKVG